MRTHLALAALVALAGCAHEPQPPSSGARAQLAPTGTLRVAVLVSNPIIGSKDKDSGELKGTTVSLGQNLAAAVGVPAKMVEYTAINRLMEDANKNVWDAAVIAVDPARASIVDFAPPHLSAEGFLTVLVPPGSNARTMADLDRPGQLVAAVRGAAPLMILERTLKEAKVAPAENENAAFDLMKTGKAQGYAQNRFMLRARSATLPGSRLLDDSFAGLQLAFAVPKGRPLAALFVEHWVEDVKDSGDVRRAIDAAGLQGEVGVAR